MALKLFFNTLNELTFDLFKVSGDIFSTMPFIVDFKEI